MSVAFFAGSFNPFTIGHRDIVERAAAMFDHVVVGIGRNRAKKDEAVDNRQEAVAHSVRNIPNVKVVTYNGLTARAAREHGATVLLRSLRNAADLAYEQPIAEANRREFGIETVFLLARPELAHISSSLVRELGHYGHDTSHLLG